MVHIILLRKHLLVNFWPNFNDWRSFKKKNFKSRVQILTILPTEKKIKKTASFLSVLILFKVTEKI